MTESHPKKRPSGLGPIGLRVPVLIEERDNGDVCIRAVADPTLAAVRGVEAAARDEHIVALPTYLAESPAALMPRFAVSGEVSLEVVEVPVTLTWVPRQLQKTMPLGVPCVVIADGEARWVLAPLIGHVVWVGPGEDLHAEVAKDIGRILAAKETSPTELEDLIVGRPLRLEHVDITITRPERGAVSELGQKQRRAQDAKRRHDAKALLREVGNRVPLPDPDAFFGREAELGMLADVMTGTTRLSSVVIGAAGVGKSALIRAAVASKMTVYATSSARIVAGQSFFGQWQERLAEVLDAAELLDAVLWFDDLIELLGGKDEGQDFAGVIRPYLDDRRVRLVCELHPDKARVAESRHIGFYSALHPVRLNPTSSAETLELLRSVVDRQARTEPHRPTLASDAIAPTLALVERYLPYRELPGKALRVVDDLRAWYEQRHATRRGAAADAQHRVQLADVYAAFAQRTGIPEFLLRDDTALKFASIKDTLARSVIGQDASIEAVAETICVVKARLQPDGKPLASFLFVGPTGVGKTEVAKTLAAFLFGHTDRLVRFDMSEFADPLAADRLIRGTDRDEGLLTRAVRRQPFAVILLDEIEKADTAVFDLLLQVLGEARLSDAKGKTAHFHNAIIIMTSNLGAADKKARLGLARGGKSDDADYYRRQVTQRFRPELVNRLDRVVAFNALGADALRRVADLVVQKLARRSGLTARGAELTVSAPALDRLAADGTSLDLGARRLRRSLEHALMSPIAAKLSALGAETGSVDVVVDVDGDGAVTIDYPKRSKTDDRAGSVGLNKLSDARLDMAKVIHSDDMAAIRDRLSYLQAQLAYGKKPKGRDKNDPRHAAQLVAQHQEHHRLTEVLARLDAPYTDVCDAEELLLTAYVADEPLEPFLVAHEPLEQRFNAAHFHALLALQPQPKSIWLFIREYYNKPMLDDWLGGLLSAADTLGWKVSGHIDRDTLLPDEQTVGPGLTFGPLRDAPALRAWLSARESPGQALVLNVRGAGAAYVMALEDGLHRHNDGSDPNDSWFMNATIMAYGDPPALVDWAKVVSSSRAAPPKLAALAATRPLRVIDRDARKMRVPSAGAVPYDAQHYWTHHTQWSLPALLQLIESDRFPSALQATMLNRGPEGDA